MRINGGNNTKRKRDEAEAKRKAAKKDEVPLELRLAARKQRQRAAEAEAQRKAVKKDEVPLELRLADRKRRRRDPGTVFRDPLPAGGGGPEIPEPEMVRIEPGEFLMGCPAGEEGSADERPQHEVRIAQPFWIGKYAVTFDEYDAFATAGDRYLPRDHGWGRGRRPVIDVSWEEAVAYAQWLSVMTGKDYRLPTEAEWEYAARAGTSTPWSFGGDESVLREYVWCLENSEGKTHPVGEKRPNPWGLYDVHGNVREWTQDCWNERYGGWLKRRAPANGSAWDSGDCGLRVARGGSWANFRMKLRSAARGWGAASGPYFSIGFRLAQDL